MSYQSVELIIWPRWMILMTAENQVMENKGIVIDAGQIIALIDQDDGLDQYHAKEEVHLPDHVILPGFINAHTHSAMTLLRGLGDDMPLMPWLQDKIWPAEAALVSAEFVADGTRLAIAEMMRSGTTCCNDSYFFPDVSAQVALECGFRFSAGMPIIEFPTAWAQNPEEYLDKARTTLEWIANEEMITACMAPHAPYTVSDESLTALSSMAEAFSIPVHIHLHETQQEVDDAIKLRNKRPFHRLKDLGLINARLLAVHMTALTDDEISDLAATGAHVVHCPESNMKLASGACRLADLLDAGVNVALGTDGCASNNDVDMLGEMRSAAFLGKLTAADAAAVPAEQVLKMATINGAKALGIADKVGSIEVGKQADLTAIDLGRLESKPMYDVISHLVYATGRHQVSDVWINGERRLKQFKLTQMDESELIAMADRWQTRVASVDSKQD